MKTFKSITTVEGMREPFVDWYSGETEAEARKVWAEDCHRYGLPDDAAVTFAEVRTVIKPELNDEGATVYAWFIECGTQTLAGGYGASEADARNDAEIWLSNFLS